MGISYSNTVYSSYPGGNPWAYRYTTPAPVPMWPGYYPAPITYVPIVREKPPAAARNLTVNDFIQADPPSLGPETQPVENLPAAPKTSTQTQSAAKPPLKVEPSVPQTFAEEVGQKVGQFVTDVIEQNPQWEAKIRNIDIDRFLQDPNSALSRVKDAYQNSRALKFFTNRFSDQVVKALPNEWEPVAQQALEWLKQPAAKTAAPL
jgi:hypothetical protein